MARIIKDTGSRHIFITGAQRDNGESKPRPLVRSTPKQIEAEYGFKFDRTLPLKTEAEEIEDESYGLIPDLALNRLQARLEGGAKKYDVNNWRKGIDLQRYYEGAITHLIQAWGADTSEDHLAAILFNISAIIETEHRINIGELPAELGNAGALKYRETE